MGFYTLVKVLTYIVCSLLAIFIGIGVYKSKKISDKFCGLFFLAILLMRLFTIR